MLPRGCSGASPSSVDSRWQVIEGTRRFRDTGLRTRIPGCFSKWASPEGRISENSEMRVRENLLFKKKKKVREKRAFLY